MEEQISGSELFPELHERLVFMWIRSKSQICRKLSVNVSQEITSFLILEKEDVVAIVFRSKLKVYHLADMRTEERDLSLVLPEGIRTCLISPSAVMQIGGTDRAREANLIHIPTGKVVPVAPMIFERNSPGVIRYDTFVYAFGGNLEPTKTCEKFNLITRIWHRIPDMNIAKFAFTPIHYLDRFLLPDVRSVEKTVEVFYIQQQTFEVLTVKMTFSETGSTALMDEDTIVIISCHGQVGRWTIGTEATEFAVTNFNGNKASYAYCSATPVKVGRDVYWQSYDDLMLIKYELDGNNLSVIQ